MKKPKLYPVRERTPLKATVQVSADSDANLMPIAMNSKSSMFLFNHDPKLSVRNLLRTPLVKMEFRLFPLNPSSSSERRFLEFTLRSVYHRILKSPPLIGDGTIPIPLYGGGTIFAGCPFLLVRLLLDTQKKMNNQARATPPWNIHSLKTNP